MAAKRKIASYPTLSGESVYYEIVLYGTLPSNDASGAQWRTAWIDSDAQGEPYIRRMLKANPAIRAYAHLTWELNSGLSEVHKIDHLAPAEDAGDKDTDSIHSYEVNLIEAVRTCCAIELRCGTAGWQADAYLDEIVPPEVTAPLIKIDFAALYQAVEMNRQRELSEAIPPQVNGEPAADQLAGDQAGDQKEGK